MKKQKFPKHKKILLKTTSYGKIDKERNRRQSNGKTRKYKKF